jgi:molecular chaperone DnaK (HSP70)
MAGRYAIGIDLGTTNSALAVAAGEEFPEVLAIPQFLSLQTTGEERLLPSALYLPPEAEAVATTARLPWESDPRRGLVGRFARDHGALLPDRLVTSAKSWLGHPHVDPRQPVLPWPAGDAERRVSPFEASRRYLEHLKEALLHHLRGCGETEGLAACETVLTVPASFDEVARTLTYEAAAAAGWGEVTLLEEQQAAFYHWLAQSGEGWRQHVRPGDLVLVCDVGGGTADFSLVAVAEAGGELRLERISVGDHLLLGGDNMDLTLAYRLQDELQGRGQKIDARQFQSLVHGCRGAKERLFAEPGLAEVAIALPSRGAGLFAGAITVPLTRPAVEETLLEGFFPPARPEERPARRRALGLREVGLEYAADPALTRHLAEFLGRSWQNVESSPDLAALAGARGRESAGARFLAPTAVLFNGGIFKAEPLRRRIIDRLREWTGETVRELGGADLDLAVARGAAVYARLRFSGEGIRIRAGTARSYYIGLEAAMPAVPGRTPPVRAVCVVPQGMEEGSEAVLPGMEFGLVTGEPVEFRFFSSSVRAGDRVGEVVDDAAGALEETASLETTLPGEGGQALPVRLHSVVSELGVLELWMRHEATGRQWKLEFNVREA